MRSALASTAAAQSASSRPRKRHLEIKRARAYRVFHEAHRSPASQYPQLRGSPAPWLIVGAAAAISLTSVLFPSGLSFAARLLTSFNCVVASRSLGRAASAEAASVMVGSTDLKVPTDELTWFARFTPPIVRSDGARPTVPVAGWVAAGRGSSATDSRAGRSRAYQARPPNTTRAPNQ